METIGIVVMIVVMVGLMMFGGHRLMMGGHGARSEASERGQGHETEQKTPAPTAVTNAVTNTNAPAPQDHHHDSPAH